MDFADRTFELREIETLPGHTDVVWCLSWNPTTGVDGVPAMIASCGGEKETAVWEENTTTGSFQCKKVLLDHETNGFIWCAWAASGSVLATSSVEGCICIWNPKSFEGFAKTNCSFLRLHEHLLVNASLCASGEFIATVVPESSIRIWKVPPSKAERFRLVSRLTDSTGSTRKIRWHPLKDILFSCTIDCNIKIWVPDADIYGQLGLYTNFSGPDYTIQDLALNGRGNKIIACSGNIINIWSLDIDMMRYGERNEPGTHLCTLAGYHDKTILSVHVSRDEIICTGAGDGAICFFIENGERSFDEPKYKLLLKKEHAHDVDINSVQWCSQDKLRLASASDDGTIKIYMGIGLHTTSLNRHRCYGSMTPPHHHEFCSDVVEIL